MNNINFSNPWLLLLAIPLLAIIIVPFLFSVKKENKSFQNVFSLITHILIVLCGVFAIAGTSYEAVVTETNVYVLADVSYSSHNNLDIVDGYVHDVEKSLPKNSKMALIAFGKDCRLISGLGKNAVSVKNAYVDDSATDIGNALRYVGNIVNKDVINRIVVITDGENTLNNNKLSSIVNSLEEDGIYIDAVFIDNNIKSDVKELQISDVSYTKSSFMGKTERAEITISSNNTAGTRIYLDVERDGKTESFAHTVFKGQNIISVPLNTEEIGEYRYTVTVRADNLSDDTSVYNNSCIITQNVSDTVNVLFIGGTVNDLTAGQILYGTDNVTYIRDTDKIPITVDEMCKYDEIVLSNFDVRSFINAGAFLNSLDIVVSKFGKTLTTYGNTYIQEGLTNYSEELTSLGGMLPVTFGNPDKDTRLVALVLDISTSMNYVSRLNVAKATAIALINTFTEKDVVMILSYSGDWMYLRPASFLNDKNKAIDIINNYDTRNGTVLSAAMVATQKAMQGYNYQNKEMIIISDGLDSDVDSCKLLAEEISDSNVIISAMGIFPGVGDKGFSGNTFLRDLVNNKNADGRGYYKSIQSEDDIDYVLRDVTEEMTDVKIEGSTYDIKIKRPQEEVVKDVTNFAPIRGFWYNTAKSGATTILTATYVRDKLTSFDVPIYTYWSYGNGTVYSFTSDISSKTNWTIGWKGEEINFFEKIKTSSLPDEKIDTPLLVSTVFDGSIGHVEVGVADYKNNSEMKITITDPKGNTVEKQLAFDSENYVCDFNATEAGRYLLHIEYKHSDVLYTTDSYAEISYCQEYDGFHTYSVSALYKIISSNGEISVDGNLKMDNSDSDTRIYNFSFLIPLMSVCVVLFVVDIIVRMLKWKDIKTLLNRKKKEEV